jgi:uncharacterized RDD family membrane protein YckC
VLVNGPPTTTHAGVVTRLLAAGVDVVAVILVTVAVVYLTVGWATTGRTYGGRLLGLRVLSEGRGLLGWTRSLVRALACALWPVGLLCSGLSRECSSAQDILFRSVVV